MRGLIKEIRYINDWAKEVKQTDFEPKEQKKMRISDETSDGLRITG